MMAASPTSQTTMLKIRPAPPVVTRAKLAMTLIVSMPNSTVETMRAQDLPARQLCAIHSHRAAPIRPPAMDIPTATCSAELIWVAVSVRFALWMALRRDVNVSRLTTMPTRLRAAPAYMTRTARMTDGGAAADAFSGASLRPGYCWYMAPL